MKYARKPYIEPAQLPPVRRSRLMRILSYLAPHRGRAAVIGICIVLGAILNLGPAWFLKRIVDVAIPHGDLRLLWLYCGGMLAGPLVAGLLLVVQKYSAEVIGQRVMLDLRVALYRHLLDMPYDFFTRQKSGDAVSHVLNDVQGVGSTVSGTLVEVMQNSVVLLSTIAFAAALDWRLALLSIAFLPLFVVLPRRVGRARKALKREAQQRLGEVTGLLTETLSVSGALLVKLSNSRDAETRRFHDEADHLRRLSLRHALVGRWFQLLLGLFEAAGPAFVLAFGGWLVLRSEIPLGTVVAFVAIMKRLYTPASQLAGVQADVITSYAYFDRVFEMLDRPAAVRDDDEACRLPRVTGRITLANVTFGYDEKEPLLSGVDLDIDPGATVGIVGPSGAGKSTLVSLMLRLYDPGAGAVLVDGIDVRRVTQRSLRGDIGVVTQDTFLFNTTVLENLRYGNPSAPRQAIEEAARRARIHETIAALPRGYETVVGDRGYCFSAGERQRLAIARVILKNPRILVLDEATSALDSETEREVHHELTTLFEGRTRVVIAHRLSTVRHADVIVVMAQGQIVERGMHARLLDSGGLYARLWWLQERQSNREESYRGFKPKFRIVSSNSIHREVSAS